MPFPSTTEPKHELEEIAVAQPANRVLHTALLWEHRRSLARVTAVALLLSLVIAFAIPKRYAPSHQSLVDVRFESADRSHQLLQSAPRESDA
jgi:hypothetical protein